MSNQRLKLILNQNQSDLHQPSSSTKFIKLSSPSSKSSSSLSSIINLPINKFYFWFNHQFIDLTINKQMFVSKQFKLWLIVLITITATLICPDGGDSGNGGGSTSVNNPLFGWLSSPVVFAEAGSSPHYPTFSFCSYIFLNEERSKRSSRSPNDVGQPPPPPPAPYFDDPSMMSAQYQYHQHQYPVPVPNGESFVNYPHQSPPPPPLPPASMTHSSYHASSTQHPKRHQHVTTDGVPVTASHHYHHTHHLSTESLPIPVHSSASTINDRLKSSTAAAYSQSTTSRSPSVPSTSTLGMEMLRRNQTGELVDLPYGHVSAASITDPEWHSPHSTVRSLYKRQSSDSTEQTTSNYANTGQPIQQQPSIIGDDFIKQPVPIPPKQPKPPEHEANDFDPYEFYYFFHNYQYQFSHSPPNNSHPVYIGLEIIDVDRINDAENFFSLQLHLFELWVESRINTSALQVFWDTNGDPIPLNEANIADCLWTPSLIFEDSTEREHLLPPTTILLAYQNRVLLRKSRYSLKVQCHMNLQIYPMDKHQCHFKVRTFTDPVHKVDLRWLSHPNSPRPDLLDNQTNRSVIFRSDFTPSLFDIKVGKAQRFKHVWLNEDYAVLDVVFIFERRIIHSLLTVYIPSSLVVTLSWLQFWFDVEAVPGRMSLGIMSTLTIMTQILTNYEKAGNHVTAVDIWLFVCLIMVFLALMEYAIAYTISHYYDTDATCGSPALASAATTTAAILYENPDQKPAAYYNNNNNNNKKNVNKPDIDGGLIDNQLVPNHNPRRPNTAPNLGPNINNNNNSNPTNNNNATTPIDIDEPAGPISPDDPANNNNLFKSKSLPGSANRSGLPANETQSFKYLSFELSPQDSRTSRSRQSMENLYRDPESDLVEEEEEQEDNVDSGQTAEELSNQLNWNKIDQIENARQRVQVALDELDTLLKDNSTINNPNGGSTSPGLPLRPLTGDSQPTRTILTLPSILQDSDPASKSGSGVSRTDPSVRTGDSASGGGGGAFLRKKKRKDPNSDINNNNNNSSEQSPLHSSLSCTPPTKPASAPLPSSPKPYLAPLSLSSFSRIASQRARLRRQYSSRPQEDSHCGGRSSLNEVDYCSRFVFPIAFVLFVCVYWIVLKVLSSES